MGRLTKTKIDAIIKLRKQGYTQKETAEKLKVHLRTVRKYDPLREQKPARLSAEQLEEIEEACSELVAQGLADEYSGGRFGITFLGRRTYEKFEELRDRAILQFMVDAGRAVSEEEVERYLHKVSGELFDEAVDEVKKQ